MKRFSWILILMVFIGLKASAQLPANDTLKFSAHKKEISTFLNALDTAGMSSIFTANQPITIFAPDDKSINVYPGTLGMKLFLNPGNRPILLHLMKEHIIIGKYTAKDIDNEIRKNNGQASFTTLAGTQLLAKININRNIVLIDQDGNQHVVKQFDIQKGNSELFIIDTIINTHN